MIGMPVFERMSVFGFKMDCDHLGLLVLKFPHYMTFLLKHPFQEDIDCLTSVVESLEFFCVSVETSK